MRHESDLGMNADAGPAGDGTVAARLDDATIAAIVNLAGEYGLYGLYGMDGACAHAAIAINAIVFDGRGTLAGAFNRAFLEAGEAVGHVVIIPPGRGTEDPSGAVYWDCDARPKTADEIAAWGRLIEHDRHYAARARALGIRWSGESAGGVTLASFGDAGEVAGFWGDHFGDYPLALYESALARACREILGKTEFPAAESEELDLADGIGSHTPRAV